MRPLNDGPLNTPNTRKWARSFDDKEPCRHQPPGVDGRLTFLTSGFCLSRFSCVWCVWWAIFLEQEVAERTVIPEGSSLPALCSLRPPLQSFLLRASRRSVWTDAARAKAPWIMLDAGGVWLRLRCSGKSVKSVVQSSYPRFPTVMKHGFAFLLLGNSVGGD